MKTKYMSYTGIFIRFIAPMSAFAATAPITPVSPISAIEVTVPEEATTWLAGWVEIALKHNLIPEALQSKYGKPLTRGEFTALVARLYEKITGEEIKERKTFADTKSADIEKVAGLGILSGVGNGKFNPDDMITREQAAVVIKRLLDKLDYKFYLTLSTNGNLKKLSRNIRAVYPVGQSKLWHSCVMKISVMVSGRTMIQRLALPWRETFTY